MAKLAYARGTPATEAYHRRPAARAVIDAEASQSRATSGQRLWRGAMAALLLAAVLVGIVALKTAIWMPPFIN